MKTDCPTSKFRRAMTGGKTAAKVGKKVLSYYAKSPFLSKEKKEHAKEKAASESAHALFQGLSLLKGTALKMAQQLSLESDVLPEAVCKELSKAYHQVPPINKALVRQVIQSGLGKSIEETFSKFDPTAFAAASLGQVHYAEDKENQKLAVKLQYPGISKTIKNDVSILRHMLMPMLKKEQLIPTIEEIAQRLYEETDYIQEADNISFFSEHLKHRGVRVPDVISDLSSKTVLTTTLMSGKPLDQWIQDNPPQKDKDHIARQLQSIFIKSLYELRCIHADPNPGNFIIADDLTIGLVDFGCIKKLSPEFVEKYRQIALAAAYNDGQRHFDLMIETGLLPEDLNSSAKEHIFIVSENIQQWFGALSKEETFDFKTQPDFILQGKKVMKQSRDLRKYFKVNPDFLFLDRTRYGLIRIFEMLGAKLSFRNPYEW